MTLLRLLLPPFGTGPWPIHIISVAGGTGLMRLIIILSGRAAQICSASGHEARSALIWARQATLLWLSFPMGLFFQAEPVFPIWSALAVLAALSLLSSSSSLNQLRAATARVLIGCISFGQYSFLLWVPLFTLWLWF